MLGMVKHLAKYALISLFLTSLMFGAVEFGIYMIWQMGYFLQIVFVIHMIAYLALIPTLAFTEDESIAFLEKLAYKKISLKRREIELFELENEKTRKMLEL